MRIRSVLAAAGVVAAVVAGLAAPALAHEEISPRTFPTGQPTFFTLTAANEEKVNLVKVVLHAPAGTPFGGTTRSPAGWTVAAGDGQPASLFLARPPTVGRATQRLDSG